MRRLSLLRNLKYLSFKEYGEWILIDWPESKNAVKCKGIYKIKKDWEGKLDRYKARLVAKVFTQKYGINYFETLSPVVKNSTIRLLLAMAIKLTLDINHMDVPTAFCN